MEKISKIFKEYYSYLIIIVAVVLIRTFIVTPVIVNGSSMEPTLNSGQVMFLWKMGDIERFDIVVIELDGEKLIKRIIGLPGETISYMSEILYIDGEKLSDEYNDGSTYDFSEVTLGKNEYYVLGDNRGNSKDSRYFGPISPSEIKGTVNFVLFPFTKFGIVK